MGPCQELADDPRVHPKRDPERWTRGTSGESEARRSKKRRQMSMRFGARVSALLSALSLRYLSACGAPKGARAVLQKTATPLGLRLSARHPLQGEPLRPLRGFGKIAA